MLQYNLNRILKARGIEHPYTWLVRQGVHSQLASAVNRNQVRRVRLGTIEKLCLVLRCTPNDLLEWVPDDDSIDRDQPLGQLLKTQNKVIDITRSLNALPLDKLEEVDQFINEKFGNKE